MNEEWKKKHAVTLEKAMAGIWTPYIMGEWRDSKEIVARVDVSGKVVLDFGAGVGRNTLAIMDAGAEAVISYDHAEMLRWMPDSHPGTRVTLGHEDAIEDHSVDVVFCSLVLQHLTREELQLALSFIRRVLRPSGVVLIYGRDCGDPPECRPIWPEINERLRLCTMQQLPTQDQHSHSVSTWRVR
jgi:SAM-dependent methyltransferase